MELARILLVGTAFLPHLHPEVINLVIVSCIYMLRLRAPNNVVLPQPRST